MASDRQITANRLNGKKGGPNTPAGRDAIRGNAITHGLYAHHPVIPRLENQSEFDEFLNHLKRELKPQGLIEMLLVNQMADAYWRRQRISRMESGMFDVNDAKYSQSLKQSLKNMTVAALLHRLAEGDANRVDMMSRYYRLDARLERSFFRAWKELKALQAARPAASQTEPEPATPPITDFAKQTEIGPAPPPPLGPEPPENEAHDPIAM